MKSTYGTGLFHDFEHRNKPLTSNHALLTTVAYRLRGEVTYALEGSILSPELRCSGYEISSGVIDHAADSEAIAVALKNRRALCGSSIYRIGCALLGPRGQGCRAWLNKRHGLRVDCDRNTGVGCLSNSRFAHGDAIGRPCSKTDRVDGGMVNNTWFAQRLADVSVPVDRPAYVETTVLGAAYLAGLQAGLFSDLSDLAGRWPGTPIRGAMGQQAGG